MTAKNPTSSKLTPILHPNFFLANRERVALCEAQEANRIHLSLIQQVDPKPWYTYEEQTPQKDASRRTLRLSVWYHPIEKEAHPLRPFACYSPSEGALAPADASPLLLLPQSFALYATGNITQPHPMEALQSKTFPQRDCASLLLALNQALESYLKQAFENEIVTLLAWNPPRGL